MSEVYNHKVVEKKWQKVWDDEKAFAATNDYSKPKYYALVEFPYPSGQGLHVGHPRPYTALDIVARKRRMQGYNVLYPMGWDAFGLPTENYAIKNKIHPKIVTENNVKHFKEQLHSLGYSFDWDREINTTDPNYYKWTQWIFLKLFKAGLAYKKEMPINWCTSCKVGLANEEVVNGVSISMICLTFTNWPASESELPPNLATIFPMVDVPSRPLGGSKSSQRYILSESGYQSQSLVPFPAA